MMGWGSNSMMNFGTGMAWFGFFGFIFWLAVIVDLILLGIWLWQKIQKNS